MFFLHFKRIDFIECKLYINKPDQKIGSLARKENQYSGYFLPGTHPAMFPFLEEHRVSFRKPPHCHRHPVTVGQVIVTPQPSCREER